MSNLIYDLVKGHSLNYVKLNKEVPKIKLRWKSIKKTILSKSAKEKNLYLVMSMLTGRMKLLELKIWVYLAQIYCVSLLRIRPFVLSFP